MLKRRAHRAAGSLALAQDSVPPSRLSPPVRCRLHACALSHCRRVRVSHHQCGCRLLSHCSPTLCDPVDCSPPGSSVHGTLQEEHWSGLSFPTPGDLPDPWIQAMSLICPALAGGFFTTEPVCASFFVCRQRDLFMNPLLACVTSQNLLGCPPALSALGLSAGGGLAPMIPCQERRRARLPGGLALPQTPSPRHWTPRLTAPPSRLDLPSPGPALSAASGSVSQGDSPPLAEVYGCCLFDQDLNPVTRLL